MTISTTPQSPVRPDLARAVVENDYPLHRCPPGSPVDRLMLFLSQHADAGTLLGGVWGRSSILTYETPAGTGRKEIAGTVMDLWASLVATPPVEVVDFGEQVLYALGDHTEVAVVEIEVIGESGARAVWRAKRPLGSGFWQLRRLVCDLCGDTPHSEHAQT